jgi:tRNA(Ile)-lysidine synthase
LAAMPSQAQRDGILWLRPWLDQPRRAIEHYVRRHRLSFVDDPSNADISLARNRLRHRVWPALQAHFDQAGSTLASSARRAHEAAECLRELAALDAQRACASPGRLDVAAWLQLSSARRGNLLRSWLSAQGEGGAPESLVQRLLHELPEAAAGKAWPAPWGALRLHAGCLQAVSGGPTQAAPAEALNIDLSRAGRIAVPAWHGSLVVTAVVTGGLEPQRLRRCELRARQGGEQFQHSSRGLPRSLKKQFQAARVPSWQRDGPLVYGSGQLLYVPGLGIDARVQAREGRPMLALRWLPDTA